MCKRPGCSPVVTPDRYDYWVHPDIHPSWTWPDNENRPLNIRVYSVYDRVELFFNGKGLGSRENSENNWWKSLFSVNYEPGDLVAVGYSAVDGSWSQRKDPYWQLRARPPL